MIIPYAIGLSLLLLGCGGNDPQSARIAVVGDSTRPSTRGERIVVYAATLLGTPYRVGGKDERGFDCSGFVSYVYRKNGLDVPSSTKALIGLGREVDLAEATSGDVIFFTGTDPNDPRVGHAGIVVSKPGEPVKFIHSSSARSSACVKYSVLDTSPGYQRRFMAVRRMW
ncbi:MAG: C40 family peptidase [Ferruginibacter sp.]|nr:C40 family peptidase [Cytophagales bacterium]